MSVSSSERALRESAVSRLRVLFPSARIVHELNMHGEENRRIDVAAITEDAIVGVEIKSEKDRLDRLKGQIESYLLRCDLLSVVAAEKHVEGIKSVFTNSMQMNVQIWSDSEDKGEKWIFPSYLQKWRMPRNGADLLGLLWADELRETAWRYNLHLPRRANITTMIRVMTLDLTGRQIKEAVCSQLRKREFAEADLPIYTYTED